MHYTKKQIDKLKERFVFFTQEHAKNIINIVTENISSIENIIVHCTLGAARSPAVAIVLAKLFPLKQEDYFLRKLYPSYNQYVYRIMKETSQQK